ncbi:MAG: outer membrane beta-barrel family protein, partial [Saprospiraceae bacterium]
RFNLGGDLNVRQGKINTFVSGNLNQRRSLSTGGTDRQNLFGNPLTNVFQSTNSENNGLFATGRAGIDWFLDNRNTFTVAGSYTHGGFDNEDDLTIRTDTLGAGSSQALRHGMSHREFENFGGQLLYKHLFPKEGKELTADLNYNGARSNNNAQYLTDYQDSPLETRQKQSGTGENNFLTVQTDFANPITAKMKIELGARAALRSYQSENENAQFDLLTNQYVRAPGFADRYQFDDQVFAAYGNFIHSFPKWGYQVGLRAESSNYTGTLLDTDSTFQNDYPLSLFPSLFVTYKLNEEDNVQLSYTRRINRPGFFNLIPYYDFSDSLQLSRGNPGLRPEFTNSFELQYQNIFAQGHNLLVSAYYKQATDLITRYQFKELNALLQREVLVSTYANSNSSIAYGTELTLKNTFFKLIDLTSNINLYNSVVDARNIESSLKVTQFTWFLKENLTLRLPQAFTLQFSGSYQSRTAYSTDSGGGGGSRGLGGGGGGGGWMGGTSSTAQGYSIPVWYMDASLRKDLWKRKGSLTLNVQDIFRSRRMGSHSGSAFFVQDTWRRRDPQLVRLTFSYRFGKFDVSLFRRKNTRVETEGGDF